MFSVQVCVAGNKVGSLQDGMRIGGRLLGHGTTETGREDVTGGR